MRHLHPSVIQWALSRCGNEADAEDIAQEVMVKVWLGLDRFQGKSRLTTWLYRITANAVAEHHRRAESGRRAEVEYVSRANPVKAHTPHRLDQTLAAQLLTLATQSLVGLSEPQRQVVRMVAFEGYEPMEVAGELGMNPNTVRSHLLRGRRALRGTLLEAHPALVDDYQIRRA